VPPRATLTGLDTDWPPSGRLSAEALEQWKRDWTGFALGYGFFRIEDEKNSDFKNSFEHALRSYARDAESTRPNPYPRECGPSSEDFRVILYAAGRYDGETGARLLHRIPDVVLRLFAEIEFAAGIAGTCADWQHHARKAGRALVMIGGQLATSSRRRRSIRHCGATQELCHDGRSLSAGLAHLTRFSSRSSALRLRRNSQTRAA
jgi:hypothetical protein